MIYKEGFNCGKDNDGGKIKAQIYCVGFMLGIRPKSKTILARDYYNDKL
jgi:hypothetical protein